MAPSRRSWAVAVIAAVLATTLIAPVDLSAQDDVPVTRLTEPDARLAEPFSAISGLRELSDGRLVVSDRIEQAVRIVDPATGSVREIGRVGQGPGEYMMPGRLLPLPGDSTLLVDFGNTRMTTIAPEGRLVGSTSLTRDAEIPFMVPSGTDARGDVYFDLANRVVRGGGGAPTVADEYPVIRWDRATDALDTIARLPRGESSVGVVRAGGGAFSFGGMSAFQAKNAWAVAPDGRIAAVLYEDYHVEWVTADGETAVGPSVPYTPVPVTDADKEAWADQMANAVVSVRSSGGRASGGGRSFNLPRPDIESVEFPEVKPPFPTNAARVTPDGELWVERYVKAGQPETYDVFDARGRRTRQVVLPEGRELIGFGDGVLYAVREDDDGLQWLERYRR